jgi:hypothetical protein
MGDEEEVVEEAPKKKKELTPVRVIAAEGKSALVEWADGAGLLRRAFVPRAKLEEDKADPGDLEKGIPYGVPWEEAVDLSNATPEAFADALRRLGVWTLADLEARPKLIRQALFNVTGITLAALHSAAKRYERGG